MMNQSEATTISKRSFITAGASTKRKMTSEMLAPTKIKESKMNAIRLLLFIGFLSIWEVAVRVGMIDPFYWSSPMQIFEQLMVLITNGTLFKDTVFTLRSTLMGFLIGTILGVVIGLSFWWSQLWAKVVEPFLIMLESVPKIALAPIVIIFFGIHLPSKIVMATLMTLIITALIVWNAVKTIDQDLIKMMYSLGANRMQVFLGVVLPSTIHWIISSLRTNIGFALSGAVVGEFIASTTGLGHMIHNAGQVFQVDVVYAGVLTLTAIAYGLYLTVGKIEQLVQKYLPF